MTGLPSRTASKSGVSNSFSPLSGAPSPLSRPMVRCWVSIVVPSQTSMSMLILRVTR